MTKRILHPKIEQFWLSKADYIQCYGAYHLQWYAYRNSDKVKSYPHNVNDIIANIAYCENIIVHYIFNGQIYTEQNALQIIKMKAFL